MLKGIIQFSHYLMEEAVNKGDTVIDATCGNGHDTVFLSEIVGENGHVFGFDIQEQAIEHTKENLAVHKITNATIIKDSHSNAIHHLTVDQLTSLGGAIFNLGYLPGSDKGIVTKSESTILAIEGILSHLKENGIVVLVVYHGHEGGDIEKRNILEYVHQLNQKQYNVLYYGFINQKNTPPFIIAIERKTR
ncbi:16S rRNA (cytosine(1402)-N(4))-methyltransferase [Virgibacillus phasianinus]|uniref:16S rRNA (Cytosine(1402)-N(4))-methyltransferase n=1 Tax=Virgibacillus phasianinus TaxID=2017483 RepID=A0A220U4S3_9BACI|nr:class I SAM-dependent methyltransferase [Virgibacillus phasianinus]ASK62906.1 16S rRNA (cytosine(1402)-N(4))-methyltransferase [Virgibacillus phasianinus]